MLIYIRSSTNYRDNKCISFFIYLYYFDIFILILRYVIFYFLFELYHLKTISKTMLYATVASLNIYRENVTRSM